MNVGRPAWSIFLGFIAERAQWPSLRQNPPGWDIGIAWQPSFARLFISKGLICLGRRVKLLLSKWCHALIWKIQIQQLDPVGRDGAAHPHAATTPATAITQATRRKRISVYPEFAPQRRCRLVVVGLEIGGRWGIEAQSLVTASPRPRREPPPWPPSGRGWRLHTPLGSSFELHSPAGLQREPAGATLGRHRPHRRRPSPFFRSPRRSARRRPPPPQPPPSKTGDLTMWPMAVKKASQKKKYSFINHDEWWFSCHYCRSSSRTPWGTLHLW